MIVSIDPDLEGAICAMSMGGDVIALRRVPITEARELDFLACLKIVSSMCEGVPAAQPILGVIETPIGNPAQAAGFAGFANQQRRFGALRMALISECSRVVGASPSGWKAAMRVTSDKATSLARAGELFPDNAGMFAIKRNHGLAEALLIAEWARTRYATLLASGERGFTG